MECRMSIWSWKQAVAEQILEIVNVRKDVRFNTRDVYKQEHILRASFPRNRHVTEKIRQTLQRLRDAGFIEFLGHGNYQLEMSYGELDWEPAGPGETGLQVPATRTVLRRVRLRDTFLAAEMKRKYQDTCQVCRERLQLSHGTYAESHHIKPLGAPHLGPDVAGNILVVCPNHHVMLDRGALLVDPSSLLVSHVKDAVRARPLLVYPWHQLNRRYIEYHDKIAIERLRGYGPQVS
jgi:hypothetical protein